MNIKKSDKGVSEKVQKSLFLTILGKIAHFWLKEETLQPDQIEIFLKKNFGLRWLFFGYWDSPEIDSKYYAWNFKNKKFLTMITFSPEIGFFLLTSELSGL